MANDAWFQLFPHPKVENLVAPASNNYPICLYHEPAHNVMTPRRHRHFKFENVWLIEPKVEELIQTSWLVGRDISILSKLNNCDVNIMHWNKTNGDKRRKEIEKCKQKLARTRTLASSENLNYFLALRKRLVYLLVQDEIFWSQRAKSFWL
ncbi:uncharacterized protein [Cicer arietinum]|uniref:Uncharacterized protein LOC105851232 n=1 Tax=Cicer arietinum TaxID=3827 RepID=A0A1S3DVU9_CICAR|nr:uncharacterized protein LOC105851232 [Cicer arietinum]